MAVSLLSLGIVCILAAIIGGGLSAFDIKIQVVPSLRRQIMLAVFGVALLIGSAASAHHWPFPPPGVPPNPADELSIGLGQLYEGDFMEAFPHINYAAQAGNKEAEYHYGEMLYHGWGCPKNTNDGIKWISKSANDGYALAQAALSKGYSWGGEGFQKNVQKATRWATQSKEQNDPMGSTMFALITEPDGSPNRIALMRKPAHDGYARAQYWLGKMLLEQDEMENRYSPGDLKEATDALNAAADQGETNAQLDLACFLYSNRKHSGCKYALSRNTPYNVGTKQDLRDSYKWLWLALDNQEEDIFPFPVQDKDQNTEDAKKIMAKIESVLPRDDQEQVVVEKNKWKAKYPTNMHYLYGNE